MTAKHTRRKVIAGIVAGAATAALAGVVHTRARADEFAGFHEHPNGVVTVLTHRYHFPRPGSLSVTRSVRTATPEEAQKYRRALERA